MVVNAKTAACLCKCVKYNNGRKVWKSQCFARSVEASVPDCEKKDAM